MTSKNKQLIAAATLTTLVAGAAVALYFANKRRHQKKLAVVSNAGYEMAYDVHFPMKYKKSS